jgi:CRISPR-associated protein Cas10/Csm1 subtype III-A
MTNTRDEGLESALKPIMVQSLQQVRRWFERKDAPFLQCAFQNVGFFPQNKRTDLFYVPPCELSLKINYPVMHGDSCIDQLKVIKEKTWALIKEQYGGLQDTYLQQLSAGSLLFLLEKLGGNIPYEGSDTISIYDANKVQSIRTIVSLNRAEEKHGQGVLLISTDISGIQKFIYNIRSARALKNLRARSFFIELLSHHVAKSILKAFHLHPVNLLINGGGSTVILSSKPDDYKTRLDDLDSSLNSWLAEELDYRLNVVIVAKEASDAEVFGDLSPLLQKLSVLAFQKKARKAAALIAKEKFLFVEKTEPTSKSCEVCQKDIGEGEATTTDDTTRCEFCETLVRIGNVIPNAKYIFIENKDSLNTIEIENTKYLLSGKMSEKTKKLPCAWTIFDDRSDFVKDLDFAQEFMFVGNYAVLIRDLPDAVKESIGDEIAELQERLKEEKEEAEIKNIKDELEALSSDENMATLEHLAACSQGKKKLIGALRMDADNLGKILQKGFYSTASLELVSSLSRNLNYFFKIYLTSICQGAMSDPHSICRGAESDPPARKWVHVIYSGGDDLFVLGAWDHIAELSIEVSNAFSRYTAANIDLGLSAGFTIHQPKYPVSKMAGVSLTALNFSKECHEPCWFCRDDWVNCPLFRKDGSCLRKGALTPFFAESKAALKQKLDQETMKIYSRHFSRLKLSFKRALFNGALELRRDEVQDLICEPLEVFRDTQPPQPAQGFLRNVTDLLDVWYRDGLLYLPKVAWLLQKQKELLQRGADRETGSSKYKRYQAALHWVSPEVLSALHVPLTWAILLKEKGGKSDDS